jgi:hypothetical protein
MSASGSKYFEDGYVEDGFVAEPTLTVDGEATAITVNSSQWTGLPATFSLSDTKLNSIVELLRSAERELERTSLPNSECAQAIAYVRSATILMEAPEPQPDIAWELIQRANNIAGLASLFVAIIALFK